MTITSTSSTEVVLLVGAVIAIAVGLLGRKDKGGKEYRGSLRAISGIVGIVMILWAILMVVDGTWNMVMLLMILVLGIGLLFPVLPRINLAAVVALIIALIAGAAVSSWGGWWILIVFLVVFFILWLVLRLIFGAARLMGGVLGSRWVLLIVGIIGLIVALEQMLA